MITDKCHRKQNIIFSFTALGINFTSTHSSETIKTEKKIQKLFTTLQAPQNSMIFIRFHPFSLRLLKHLYRIGFERKW